MSKATVILKQASADATRTSLDASVSSVTAQISFLNLEATHPRGTCGPQTLWSAPITGLVATTRERAPVVRSIMGLHASLNNARRALMVLFATEKEVAMKQQASAIASKG